MHVRVRLLGKPEAIIVVESKLSKIEKFRQIIKEKFDVDPKLQRLFYGGKLLEDGYTFHDYNIKLNDVIQLMVKVRPDDKDEKDKEKNDKKVEDKEKNDKKVEDKEKNDKNHCKKSNAENTIYKDAESTLYAVGDYVDVRDREQGAWFEGKIVRIVYDPDAPNPSEQSSEKEDDAENKLVTKVVKNADATKNKNLVDYFKKASKDSNVKQNGKNTIKSHNFEENLLYQVQLDADEEDSDIYCKLKEIRPRARTVINIKDLKVGQRVMINYNPESSSEKGYWYDFKVDEIKKLRVNYELVGTVYLGPDAIPQNDTKVKIHDKIFSIEEVVPLDQRKDEYKAIIAKPPEKRSLPYNCLDCHDDENAPCKSCGCYVCLGKDCPDKIILCDECNNGYHMYCLKPPMSELPEDDWYCPCCKRDPNEVVAPGAAKQRKKASTTKRDWGRGMACVGKTKTCAMPANHFGPIPGIDVGMCWRFRIQLSESGVHRPPVSGIHGRDIEGAYSIVLSGGYEDDVDNGNEFTYTGSGGRDLSGNKRTAEQSCDQTLTRENRALARNCAVPQVNENGADAGKRWREGRPVRVVRSYKMLKHFPKYAPQEGIRYDGIYKVVKYYPEKGLSGYRVWKYLLRRDDSSPAPWEPDAKQYPMIYPDGYLEAEAEKKTLKEKNGKNAKKRILQENNDSQTYLDDGPSKSKISRNAKTTKSKHTAPEKKRRMKTETTKRIGYNFTAFVKAKSEDKTESIKSVLTTEEKKAINADTLNSKLWEECLEISEKQGKKEFVEHVTQVFLCIICQEVVVSPVTTSCLHNFCMACINLAFKSTGTQTCPYCRQNIANNKLESNDKLKLALRTILTGYDAGKK